MKNARHEESNKPIEDDDEFEKEEDDIFPDNKESEKEVTVKI